MNDTKIIFNVIQNSIPNDHPSVYQYIHGNKQTRQKVVNNIANSFNGILCPPYSIGHVRRTVKTFLKNKEEQYKRGEIKISPIY